MNDIMAKTQWLLYYQVGSGLAVGLDPDLFLSLRRQRHVPRVYRVYLEYTGCT